MSTDECFTIGVWSYSGCLSMRFATVLLAVVNTNLLQGRAVLIRPVVDSPNRGLECDSIVYDEQASLDL